MFKKIIYFLLEATMKLFLSVTLIAHILLSWGRLFKPFAMRAHRAVDDQLAAMSDTAKCIRCAPGSFCKSSTPVPSISPQRNRQMPAGAG